MPFHLHHKTFTALANSAAGTITSETVFHYTQEGDLITAHYAGGGIVSGHIIAKPMAGDQLQMLYHCLTDEGELKAGKATAQLSLNKNQDVEMKLKWQWMTGEEESGESHYVEI